MLMNNQLFYVCTLTLTLTKLYIKLRKSYKHIILIVMVPVTLHCFGSVLFISLIYKLLRKLYVSYIIDDISIYVFSHYIYSKKC